MAAGHDRRAHAPRADARPAQADGDPRPARQPARRGGAGRADTARDADPVLRARDRPQGRAPDRDGDVDRQVPLQSAISPASTSRRSLRSIPSRSAISRPAGSSPTARRCCCSARRASARPTSRWRSGGLRSSPATRCCSSRRPRWWRRSPGRTARGGSRTSSPSFAKPRLLIVDELGYLPFEPDAAHLFFQLVSRRYERGSLLITSNRAIGEWGTVFGDPVVATAILDRLLHHSHVVTIRGDSYRLREKRRSGLLKATSEPRALAANRMSPRLVQVGPQVPPAGLQRALEGARPAGPSRGLPGQACRDTETPTQGVSSLCRQGVNSRCRLTDAEAGPRRDAGQGARPCAPLAAAD